MTQEEKAKAYDDAIERAKKQLDGAKVFDYKEKQIAHDIRTTTYAIFPEIKESEDEKIIKWLMEGLRNSVISSINNGFDIDMGKMALAWLEKQKLGEWSEEDEYNFAFIQEALLGLDGDDSYREKCCKMAEWLESLKGRVGCEENCTTTKQWSEEDERIRKSLIASLSRISANTRTDSTSVNYAFIQEINWLKSLIPQNTWKPSDEQMERLKGIINSLPHQEVLYSLYQDLLKLKG